MKCNRPYFEATFHARLTRRLADLGYSIKTKGRYWDIAGINADTLKKFSNRTDEIEDYAKAMGIVDKSVKDTLGSLTRKAKLKNLDEDALRKEWIDRLTPDEIRTIEKEKGTQNPGLTPAESAPAPTPVKL